MKARYGLLASLVVMVTFNANAEVYRSVDAQGNVTYSDEPSQDAKVIKVAPVTTITLPKPDDIATDSQARSPDREAPAAYSRVRFSEPRNNDAFHSGSGDVEFFVTSDPALRPGHKYEVELDGQPVGQSTSGAVMVRNVFRGTHQANVYIVNNKGIRVASGDGISFTVHRPSVNNRPRTTN